MSKKRKKSLVGYTFPHWYSGFTKSHPNWKGRVFNYAITDKPSPLADVKVRITIEEI